VRRNLPPRNPSPNTGLFYVPRFVPGPDRAEVMETLLALKPLWEDRYSHQRPLPPRAEQRRLLRPVYWLGNWQFACLDYYRPPQGTRDRCVRAEPYPAPLARLVSRMEALARRSFAPRDLPRDWRLNTCLVNYYGSTLAGERWIDTARVGEHKDFEPGPVASISFGERALFQFVSSRSRSGPARVVLQQWLEDGALQLFGGPRWKEDLFHRVQRVEKKQGTVFPVAVEGFRVRRINLTFRYVPEAHVTPYARLGPQARGDVREYMEALATRSPFFARELAPPGEASGFSVSVHFKGT